ncbi:Golgi-specific brefeldin A-resistance guanine nucleotide exchange factor 1 [Liparis tanakae]|uniref:Golgi-specific brefeldin A-resistance guanine nucleotide exchange factor 1 n=1 Tax=Liparis tanakae TaxID=230148 RepID=A0A4Z2EBL7_9TELE|nr:Golgi-specific brefeldin A-resistance guanine nucleotide exchange factor 1 [Liparis tanakae]
MLLVMDTAGIFHSADSRTGYSDLWEITWERIVCFLPHLREELFKQTVIPDPAPGPQADPVQPSSPRASPPPPAQTPSPVPVNPAETRTSSRPASPLESQPGNGDPPP